MTSASGPVPSSGEIWQLDAAYRGLPSFEEWTSTVAIGDLWEETVAILEERRASAGADAFDRLVEEALRAAAIDTGAIEGLYSVDRGFTMSVARMTAAWEAQIAREKGSDTAALVAAQRRAYDLALDAATGETEISEAWIRRLHEEVCAAQDTFVVHTDQGRQAQRLPKGKYKQYPNHVLQADGSAHSYAPVASTSSEMHIFVEELRSAIFQKSHPVLQAAYAHYGLVSIHPFADGNGRVARVLASVYSLRALSLPLVVYADQKDSYLDALGAADADRPQAFVDFLLFRAVDLQLYLAEALKSASVPLPDETLTRLRRSVRVSHGGMTHEELDVVAHRLLSEIRTSANSLLQDLKLGPTVDGGVSGYGGHAPPTTPIYRATHRADALTVHLRTPNPGSVRVEDNFYVLIAVDPMSAFAFRIEHGPSDALAVRFDEVHPMVSQQLQSRLRLWLERIVAEALSRLAERAEEAPTQ